MTVDSVLEPHGRVAKDHGSPTTVHVGRLVVGALLAAVGVGWFLDALGMSVPWRLLPASALILTGAGLLVTLWRGRGRGLLLGVGVVTLAAGIAVGVGADRYAGPVGDRVVTPTVANWPVTERVSAGTVTLDLTRHPLPETGSAIVDIGAGRIVLQLPADDSRVQIDARVTAGSVQADGVKIADGLDIRWSQQASTTGGVDVQLNVGMGDIEVNHG